MARAQAKYELVAEDKTQGAFRSFRKSVVGAGRGVARVGGIAAVAGVAGFAALARNALKSGDRIDKLSGQTGLSVDLLSRMALATQLVGTDLEKFAKAMPKLSQSIERLGQGDVKELNEAFSRLGFTFQDIKGLTPDEQLKKVGFAIAGVERESERQYLANLLLGRSFRELFLLFKDGEAGFDALASAAEKTGTVLSKEEAAQIAAFNDQLTIFGDTIQGLVNGILLQFLPAMTRFVTAFQESIVPALKSVIGFIGSIASVIGDIQGGAVAAVVQAAQGNFSGAGAVVGGVFNNLFGGDGETDPDIKRVLTNIEANTRTAGATVG